MISVYARLRRHPLLVVAMLACSLVEMGIGSVIRLGVFWGWLPFTIVMVIAVVLRRRYPVGAFGVAVAAGALQVLTGVHLSGTDLAIVILLYTLAAYGRVRPRSASVPGLVVCLLGAAAAALTWGHPKDVSTGTALLAEAVVLMGPVLIEWPGHQRSPAAGRGPSARGRARAWHEDPHRARRRPGACPHRVPHGA